MKKSILTLSLVLPLTVFANSKIELKLAEEFNDTLNLSQLDQNEFTQVEKGVFIYEGNQKTIEITRGAKGLEKYIDDLENQLNRVQTEDNFVESNYKYEKLLSDISFYSSKLDDLNSTGNKNLKPRNENGHFGACQPYFEQDYSFVYSIFGGTFFVDSSYPPLPGPFPPAASVTITASSELNTITTQGIYHDYNSNSLMAGNFMGGSTSASAGYFNGLAIVTSFNWRATSTLSKGKCFEYIVYTGTI